MQNLAYNIDVPTKGQDLSAKSITARDGLDVCAACGEPLFGPDAEACSWQAWGTFWEILGLSNVELVCAGCREYLQKIFDGRN